MSKAKTLGLSVTVCPDIRYRLQKTTDSAASPWSTSTVIYHATPKAVSLDSIRAETKNDSTLQQVKSAMQSADWRAANNDKHVGVL